MTADAFTREKFEWLDQVCADQELTPLCFKLAYILSQYTNRDKLEAWPAQETLASLCGITRQGLKKALTTLVKRGHLKITPGNGRALTSRYRWVVVAKKNNGSCTFREEKGQPVLSVSAEDGATDVSPFPQKGATLVAKRGNSRFKKGATAVCTIPLKETSEETMAASAAVTSYESDLYRRGREVIGPTSGGMIKKLLAANGGNIAATRAAVETSSTKGDAKQYLGAVLKARERGGDREQLRLRGEAW